MPVVELRKLPENTVGQRYAKWVEDYRMSPDGRDPVRYIDDNECAYVMQRYRECHDIYHAILGIPALVDGEIALEGVRIREYIRHERYVAVGTARAVGSGHGAGMDTTTIEMKAKDYMDE